MKQFEVGKTYAVRSTGDHNMILPITIVKRTPKMITYVDKWGETTRTKIHISYDEIEEMICGGRYSMAPNWYASNEVKA